MGIDNPNLVFTEVEPTHLAKIPNGWFSYSNPSRLTELRRLEDYSNKFHHDTNPADVTELINDQELLDHCLRTIAFTRRN